MKSLLRTFILIFLVIGIRTNSAFATHVSGGDISYKCLGNNQYKITLNLFRDCSGIDMESSETINIVSSCDTQNLSAALVNPNGTEISQLCAAQTPNSTCNSGNLPGMQRYTYEATATMVPCSDWVISWNTCCRNDTKNVPSSDLDGSYIEATLNSTNDSCNNSPVFTSQPIPYVCANIQVIYNWGITEVDGDSLTYQLFSARQYDSFSNTTSNLTYTSPYSATNPINGITINQFTGQITFTPTINGNFIVAVLVKEYDSDGNLIGTTMRDIQFVVQTCFNDPPAAVQGQITNLTGTANLTGPFSLELCDEGNFSFTVSISDTNSQDTVSLTSNVTSVLAGSVFSFVPGNPATATISWTAPPGSTFFNYFTVFANDGACPIPGIQSYVYQISVNPGTVAGPDTTILCGVQTAQLSAINGNTFVWSVISGDPMVEGVNFSCDTCPNPIASPDSTTLYEVVSDLASSTCKTKDTVQVKVVSDFTYLKAQDDSSICLKEEVQFSVIPDSTSASYTYYWTPSGIFDDNSSANPTATFNSSGIKTIYFETTSLEGCVKTDSMQVNVSTGLKPEITIMADTSICIGDSSMLTATILNSIPQSCGLSAIGCGGIPIPITIGNNSSVLSTTSYPAPYGNWYKGVKHQILFLASELQAMGFLGGQITSIALNIASVNGTTTYNEFEIKMGCTSLTSLNSWQTGLVTVFPAQTINITTGWNTHTFATGFDWDGNSNIIVDICTNNQSSAFTLNSSTYYSATSFNSVIYYKADNNATLCSSPGALTTSINRPNVRFVTCGGAPTTTYAYSWFPSTGLSDSAIANPWANIPSDTSYTVIITDTIGECADTASVSLHLVPNFTYTSFQSDSIICKGDMVEFTVVPDSATPPYTHSWVPADLETDGVTFNDDSIFNPEATFDSSGTKTIYFTVSNNNGCNKSDSMTVFVGSAPKPIVYVVADTTICTGDSTQLNAIISNAGPSSNYSYSWTPVAGLSDSASAIPWAADSNIYTVLVRDTVGDCSDTVSIKLYLVPGFNFTNTQSDDSVCMMEQVQFMVSPDSTGNPYSISWTPGTIMNDATIANPIGTFNSPGTRTINFNITNSEGCTKSDSMIVFVASAIKPDVVISGDTAICVGESGQLNATITTNVIPTSCGLSATSCIGTPAFITIGTATTQLGNTSYPAPYGNFWKASKHQILFTKAELNTLGFTGGQINSLALDVATINGTTKYKNFEIKMGCTSLTALTTWQSGLVTVFSADSITITTGWNTYNFLSGFNWDGNTNIIVDICFNNQPDAYTNNSPTYYTATTFNSVIYSYSDIDPAICTSPSSFSSTSTLRPNVKFGTCGSLPPTNFIYSWSPGSSLNNDSVANPIATPSITTLYSIVVTDSTGNCADTSSINVKVGPSFTFNLLQSDTAICLGESVQLNVIPSAGIFTYQWTPSANLSNTNISNPVAGPMATSGIFTFNVDISSSLGCTIDTNISFVVSQGDVPDITITGDTVICEGSNTQLIATSAGGNSPTYSFVWTADASLSNSNIYNPVATPTTATTYSVIVTDTIGHCFDNATFSVGIISIPNPQITTVSDTVCFNDGFMVLSANPSGGTWSGSGTTINGIFSPDLAGTGSHNIIYTLTVPPSCTGKDTVKINVYQNPPVPTASANNPYCAFSTIDSLKANNSGGTITWYGNSTLTDTFYVGNTIYNLAAGADSFDLWVTETSPEGCKSNGAYKLTVQVTPNPTASFSANPEQGNAPLNVSFNNTSQPNSTNFTWNFAGLDTSHNSNPSFVFNQPGTYEVVLTSTDANGCADATSVTIIVEEGTKLIIPNIFTPDGDGKNDVFKIQYAALSDFHIVVFNRWGLKVYESNDPGFGWDGKDLQGQIAHSGVYFYVITAKDRNGNIITRDDITGTVTLVKD